MYSNNWVPAWNNSHGRRGWQSWGRGGRFNRAGGIHSAWEQPNGVQMSQSTDLSVTAAAESSLRSDHNAARSMPNWRRGRNNRRPFQPNGTNRPDSVPLEEHVTSCHTSSGRSRTSGQSWGRGGRYSRESKELVSTPCVSHDSRTQQVINCSLSSSVAFTTDVSESVDMDTYQAGDMYAVDRSTVIDNRDKNARRHECGGLRHENRGQLSSRHLMSRRSRGRSGGHNHAIHCAHEESVNVQLSQSTDISRTAAVGHCSSSLTFDHNAARGNWRRGRGNRRPYCPRVAYRSYFEPTVYEPDCDSMQQVEDWLSLSTTDASELADVNTHQASNIFAAGSATVINNRGKYTRRHPRGKFVHGSGGRLISRQPNEPISHSVSYENNEIQHQVTGRIHDRLELASVSSAETSEWIDDDDDDDDVLKPRYLPFASRGKCRSSNVRVHGVRGSRRGNSETRCQVTGTTPFESRMHDQIELELVSNAETDEWVDDDNDDDGDTVRSRNFPVGSKGKQKNRNATVHCNRRRHNKSGRCQQMSVSQETTDAEYIAQFTPIEAYVRGVVVEQGSNAASNMPGRRHKNFKQKASRSHQVRKMASSAPVSAAVDGGSDSAVKTRVASDVEQTDVDMRGKNSSSKPSSHTHVDENSLFWHLVNEHRGKCCVDELRKQLNTADADNAIAIFRKFKRIKILINESDKWMSVAFVFLKGLRMCLNVKRGCKKTNCSFLHVCPDYVTESCLAGQQCRFGHNVGIPRNESCLQKCGIPHSCSSESILTIVRTSNPIICAGYNGVRESHCQNPDQCIQLHLCNYFFCDRCLLPDDKCILGHDLTSPHNAELLKLYGVSHLLEGDKLKTLHQMILPFHKNNVALPLSRENVSKTSKMMTTRETSQARSPDSVAVVRPNVRTGGQFQMPEHEMKDTVTPSLISDGQPFTGSAAEPSSIREAKQPITLPRFVVSPDLTSKTNSVIAGNHIANDRHNGCSSSVSTQHPNVDEVVASVQSSEFKITDDTAYQQLTDGTASCMNLAEVNETAVTGQPSVIHRFATRRSQSTKTPEFRDDQCQVYMKHLCNESNECSVRHDSLPYVWRVQDAGKWVAFDDIVGIEQAFCVPDNSTYTASYQVHNLAFVFLDIALFLAI